MITLIDGTKIEDFHEQDCCESVYADWPDDLQEDLQRMGVTCETIEVEFVKNFGIKLNGISIPCYNSQNGYYSDMLDLIITKPDGSKAVYDLTGNDAIQHDIN